MKHFSSIGIIGTGNVGTQLAIALHAKGHKITYVYNRTPSKAIDLAQRIQSQVADSLEEMKKCDVVILAVSDNELSGLITLLKDDTILITTSGGIDVLPLAGRFPIGVLYPLQSFTKGISIDFNTIPLFIESSDDEFRKTLNQLAISLSNTVVYLTATQRLQLHIAAVFINNFTNHMIALGQAHLERHNLSFDWMKPLLQQTIEKLAYQDAYSAQTGPARRHDTTTIARHIEQLPTTEQIIYQLISEHIRSMYPKV